jgi:hypothetical protein
MTTHWPYAMRGLRGSMGHSQSGFADGCELGQATVERWESGKAIPFRGDALKLLSQVRDHLEGPIQASQALNLAAGAVLPHITGRPPSTAAPISPKMLVSGKHDHRDLARPLLSALFDSRILVPIEPGGDELEDTYFPLVGRLHHTGELPPWAYDLVDALGSASDSDRSLVLDLVKRLTSGD